MRRFTSIVLAMTMVIVSLSTTAFADDKKVQAPINISSKTAILMDVGSGQILFEKNPHEKLPPASVTKVMTMLLIVEALDSGKIKLDDEVQISERASEMGGSQIFLEPGETQKVDDLLKGIAVASANDACVAMAEFVGGSEEEFVAMMNNKAKQLGMKDTNFSNTNGLPIENHYTSAHDIALMSRELLKHDKITKYLTTWMDQIVVGKKKTTIGLANTNKMIKHYQGATGVKTGFTQEAKYCLSASAKRGETHLVAVTLGAPTTQERFKDSSSLLSYGFANYESVKLCSKSDKIATLTLDKADDNKVNLVAKDDLTALIKKGESKDFTKKIDVSKNIDLPVKKGTKLGTISIYKGDKQVGKIDLINEKDINKASYFKMFERVIDNIF
ncbi:D-alanyl-D-alanine carboxypeptidase family protein [Paraclostridium tenue]|uniref:serine-type D-Ala-D-Ala carboxypeptidase n=1 Tax=Paraclostridium tenue TaxID=1737 RepID=A0ABN1M7Q7_9FIRM